MRPMRRLRPRPHSRLRRKKILEIDIPHPRDYSVLTSPRFRELMEETVNAVHEEAVKAFEAGEKEM